MRWHLAVILLASGSVCAVEFEKKDQNQIYQVLGGVPVVSIGATSYSVYQAPTVADMIEVSATTEKHAKLKSKLSMGEPVSSADAEKVLDIYYNNTAIDASSIKIRNFKVGTPTYVVWCTKIWAFGCLEWNGAAGTWVEFEINGKNRSGGLTGYQRTILLMRKFSGDAKDSLPITESGK